MADLSLNQIFVKEDVVQLDAVQGDLYYIVNLHGSLKRDVSRMATLQRSIINTHARPAGTLAEVKGTLYQELSTKISQLTQVSEICIDNIQSITPETGRLPHPFPQARVTTSTPVTPPQPPPPVCLLMFRHHQLLYLPQVPFQKQRTQTNKPETYYPGE